MKDSIFRAYDIRGIYDIDLTNDDAYVIGKAFGSKMLDEGKMNVLVGYDTRSSSKPLFDSLSRGLLESGIDIINIGEVTTPMYYYALFLFKSTAGIMITASHNPKEYNGFKMTFNGKYNAYGDDIQSFKNFINAGIFRSGKGKTTEENIKIKYIDFLFAHLNFGDRQVKVVVDVANASGSLIIKDVMKRLKMPHVSIFSENDPSFPNHHPDPSVEENLVSLKEEVLKSKADVGFAFDGDADRIGLIDEKGNFVSVDKVMIIFLRNLINKFKNKNIVYDVKCSKALEDEIIKLGGVPVLSRTGNSFLRAAVVRDNLSFAGELSGHIFFNDKFEGFDDGIYAMLRMVEIMSNNNLSISEMLEGINHYYSTNEIKIRVTEDTKFKIIDLVKQYANSKNYNVITIDGVKVIFEDGFALIRASNTGPDLTLRFEGNTENRLNEIKEEFDQVLNHIKTLV
jgi:phosphomannomutase/phosphoglucomutase